MRKQIWARGSGSARGLGGRNFCGFFAAGIQALVGITVGMLLAVTLASLQELKPQAASDQSDDVDALGFDDEA